MELPPILRDAAARRMRVLLILWGAFLASILLYGVLGLLLAGSARDAPAPEALPGKAGTDRVLPVVLAMVSITLLGASALFRFGFARMTMKKDSVTFPGILASWQQACVLGWAIAEAVGLFGILAVVAGATRGSLLAFVTAAFLAVLVEAPRRGEVDALAEEARSYNPDLLRV